MDGWTNTLEYNVFYTNFIYIVEKNVCVTLCSQENFIKYMLFPSIYKNVL